MDCPTPDPIIAAPCPTVPSGGVASASTSAVVLCDPTTGAPILVTQASDGLGGLVTVYFDANGSPVVPTGIPVLCPDARYTLVQNVLCDDNDNTVLVRFLFDMDSGSTFAPTFFDPSTGAPVAPAFPLVTCPAIPDELLENCGFPGLPCTVSFLEDANLSGNQNGSIQFTNTPFNLQSHIITYNLTVGQANFVEDWYTGALVSGFDPLHSVLFIPLDVPAWGTAGQINMPVCAWWFTAVPVRVGNSITFSLNTQLPQPDGCPDVPEFGPYLTMLGVANTSFFNSNPGPWGPVPTTNGGEGPFAYSYNPGGQPGSELALRVFNCRTIDVEYVCTDSIIYPNVRVTTVSNDLGEVGLITFTDVTTGQFLQPGVDFQNVVQCGSTPNVPVMLSCDYGPVQTSPIPAAAVATMTFRDYDRQGDDQFQVDFDFTNWPAVSAMIQAWVAGTLFDGDMLFLPVQIDPLNPIPPSTTGDWTIAIGEWMLGDTLPVLLAPNVWRFTLNTDAPAPCPYGTFTGGSAATVEDNVAQWLQNAQFEYSTNPLFIGNPIQILQPVTTFPNALIIRVDDFVQAPVIKIADIDPVRVDQQPVPVLARYRQLIANGEGFDAASVGATSFTVTVISGEAQCINTIDQSSPLVPLTIPAGVSLTWGIDSGRGQVANYLFGGFGVLAVDTGSGVNIIIHWTEGLG